MKKEMKKPLTIMKAKFNQIYLFRKLFEKNFNI